MPRLSRSEHYYKAYALKCEHFILYLQDKWTPLMYAVREGHIDVVKVILDTESVNILAVNGVRYSVSILLFNRNMTRVLSHAHTERPDCAAYCSKSEPTAVPEGHTHKAATSRHCSSEGKPIPQGRQGTSVEVPKMRMCILSCSDQQKGCNVLHRVCCGPEGSVETLQWLLEVMPHLKTPEILNEGKNVNTHCKKYHSYSYLQHKGGIAYECGALRFRVHSDIHSSVISVPWY